MTTGSAYVSDEKSVGEPVLGLENLREESAETEFWNVFRYFRNGEQQAYERSQIIDHLTSEQEDKLKEMHAEVYHGTDDDMPDAYEGWLEDLSLTDLKEILK